MTQTNTQHQCSNSKEKQLAVSKSDKILTLLISCLRSAPLKYLVNINKSSRCSEHNHLEMRIALKSPPSAAAIYIKSFYGCACSFGKYAMVKYKK